jgi:hypothetical protein
MKRLILISILIYKILAMKQLTDTLLMNGKPIDTSGKNVNKVTPQSMNGAGTYFYSEDANDVVN